MQEEGSPVYNPRCAQAFAVKPQQPPPKPTPQKPTSQKPTKPKPVPAGPPQKKPKVEPQPTSDGGDDDWEFSADEDDEEKP